MAAIKAMSSMDEAWDTTTITEGYRALDLFVDLNIPYLDAYHAVAMDDLGCTQILSFDRDFDRIPGIERVEP